MKDLLPLAEKIGALLKQRKETIAIAESSSGGLIAASLLSVPGASAYFLGGAVVYTRKSMQELVGLNEESFKGMRGLTEPTALVLAKGARDRLSASWGIAEIGAAGPTGSRYGDAAGTSAIAVVGASERAAVIRTGKADRITNMRAFAEGALRLFEEILK
jgi:nicotinamide-nucleotide amidase